MIRSQVKRAGELATSTARIFTRTALSFSRRPPPGARPGTLVIDERAGRPQLHRVRFSETFFEDRALDRYEDVTRAGPDADATEWVDVRGLGSEETLRGIAERFDLHPLALEDIVNAPQRPKVDTYGDDRLVIVRMLQLDRGRLDVEQLSIVIGDTYVLTFQEKAGDVLEPVRERLRQASGRIRTSGPNYLAYAIIDAVIDAYYPVVEVMNEELEELEDLIMERPDPELLERLSSGRRVITQLRRALAPERQALRALVSDDQNLVDGETRVFLRDTYENCLQLSEYVDAQREAAGGLLQTYLSVMSHRTNEVMKVLTIMASIFIPLTFIAGIYGMNFEHMPELSSQWAYPAVWGVMVATTSGLLLWFRRLGWIGR